MKTATRPDELSSRAHGQHRTDLDEAPSKIARILAHLLAGASVNRLEAEGLIDHCLPTTIAVLAYRHGLTFKSKSERAPNRWGAPCTVTRYSLTTSEHQRARTALPPLQRTAPTDAEA